MFANIIGPTQSVDSDAGMGMRCLMGSLVSLKYLSASVVRLKKPLLADQQTDTESTKKG